MRGRIKGALFIPQVPDYPESELETISSDRIRDVLPLKVADLVPVGILQTEYVQKRSLQRKVRLTRMVG